ncbi:hypothetical protein WNY37_07785 [Henriciella sp. AS95]|uniref:hypothetical protein n=1 Tax=Henriciella sp. AS95 TaxID=3135782 RepID=UPI00317C2608
MLILPLLIGLLALWMWSLVKMPSKQARDIFEANGPTPSEVSDLDRAFVLDLHRRFGAADFRLKAVRGRQLDPEIAEKFGVKPASLDDQTELGVRLPHLKLLVSFEPGRYRLTHDAARLAQSLATKELSLENANHG